MQQLAAILKRPLWTTAIALGSGSLMALAAAPANAWGFAWVALVPVWGGLWQGTRRSALLGALAWGLAYHGWTLAWITGLHPLTWLGVPWLASVAITGCCWGFITLWGAATVLLWAWLVRRWGTGRSLGTRLVLGVALWCGLETIRSWSGLDWTALAFTQSPGNLWILHLGQLSGANAITAAIVACNGLLAAAWWPPGRPARWRLTMGAIVLVGALHGLGASLARLPIAQPADQALTVGIIQGNIPTREKLTPAGLQQAVRAYVGGYEQLVSEGAAAVLTPEGALPWVWDDRDRATNPLHQAVVRLGGVAWLGTFYRDQSRAPAVITQSLLTLTGTDAPMGRYSKIKLVPLGEYVPFRAVLGGLIDRLSPIKSDMVPGAWRQQFETPFGRAIASICYDSAFAEIFRSQAAAGGQFILTASNLDPYSEVLMAQHQAQDILRAIETDRWALRATNTGYSSVLDPHGRVVWRSTPHTYQLHIHQIYRRQTQTLYVQLGDWLTPCLGAAAIGLKLRERSSPTEAAS